MREVVELTRELIRIPSMNPPGGEDQIADFVRGILEDAGIDSVRIPLEKGRSSVVARIPGKNSGSVVLCGHLDTVRADEREWSHSPFAAELEGDRIYGLGAADMKSGVA
ncbi:M20 family peptidase, partial [Candidatus Acetothermia bacterium]